MVDQASSQEFIVQYREFEMFAVRQHWLRLLELANLRHHGTPANDLYGSIFVAASTALPSDGESSTEATRTKRIRHLMHASHD
jgi:hypothetical protein